MITRRRIQRSIFLSRLLILAALAFGIAGAIARPGEARAQYINIDVTFTSCPSYIDVIWEIGNFSNLTKTITFGPGAKNCTIAPIIPAHLNANSNLTIKGNGLTWLGQLPIQTENLIEASPNSTLTLDGVTLKRGLYAIRAIGANHVTVMNSTITQNDTGIQASSADNVTVINSNINANDKGIVAADVSVVRSSVSGNAVVGLTASNATVINSSISGNGGDGIDANHVRVIYSTISGNGSRGINASSGDTQEVTGNVGIVASLLANNAGPNCTGIATLFDGGYNFSDDASCGFLSAKSKNDATNLRLGTLSNQGGPSVTIPLLEGSSAIDAIPVNGDGFCVSPSGNPIGNPITGFPIINDQRGEARPFGAGCDVGAYEVRTVTPDISWGPSPTTFTYGSALGSGQLNATASAAGSFSYSYSGTTSGADSIFGAATNGTVLPAGTYTLTATFTPDDTESYSAATDEVTLSVNPAALTISAQDASMTYGASTLPAFTVGYSGFVNEDTSADLAGSLTCVAVDGNGQVIGASAAPGAYTIDCSSSTLSDPSYTIAYQSGALTIAKASLTVTADDLTRAYGAANPPFTASYDGFVNGDDASALGGNLTFTTSATAANGVGDYTVTPAGLASPNYDITFQAGVLHIMPAPLSVKADDASRAYGAANPPFTGALTGVVNGDNITASYGTTASADSPVGAYSIIPVLGDPDGKLVNYTVVSTNGALTVTKAPLTVTPDDATRAYGDPQSDFAASAVGLLNGDTLADLGITCATDATPTSPAGVYALTCSGDAGNYAVSYQPGTLTITKAELTVTADDQIRRFGLPNPSLTITYNGFANGESLATSGVTGSPACATTAYESSPAGSYPITCTQATLTSAKYTFTIVPGELTVTYTGGSCMTGRHVGPLTIEAGQSICFGTDFRHTGPITIQAGGALYVDGATLTGPVRADGAIAIRLCGARLTGPLSLSGTTGPVVVGNEEGTPECVGNTIIGPVRLDGNQGGVVFNDNFVIGLVVIRNTTGTNPPPDASPVDYRGNTVTGPERILP